MNTFDHPLAKPLNRGLVRMISCALLILSVPLAFAETEPLATARDYAAKQGVPELEIKRGMESALWREDKSAVALCFANAKGTVCLVLVKTNEGAFKLIDVSRVEGMNFGKIGERRERYQRFQTVPEKWRSENDTWWSHPEALCQVRFITRAWLNGQRYTVGEPLVIKKDMTPWWR